MAGKTENIYSESYLGKMVLAGVMGKGSQQGILAVIQKRAI